MQVEPIKPRLQAPGIKLLKLKCDVPLSNFAFKFNLRRYTLSAAAILTMFAERNLLYPDNRRRFAEALKTRDAFQAFILSGAGMLEHDGERRVRTRSLTACL
jgi:hypothetical protein